MDGPAPTCARGSPSPTIGISLGELPYLSAPWFSHPVMDGTIYLRLPETAAGTCSERQLAGKSRGGVLVGWALLMIVSLAKMLGV